VTPTAARAARRGVIIALLAAGGCDGGATKLIGADQPSMTCKATPAPPPASLGLPAFYQKYLDATGVPVVSSAAPDDTALVQSCLVVEHMLKLRADIRERMIRRNMHVAIIGVNEKTTDIPEYADLYQAFPGNDWDSLRGVGATLARPVSSVGEENALCLSDDPYSGENVLVETFASAVLLAVEDIDSGFQRQLQSALNDAVNSNHWLNTYATQNEIEYYAMGVQTWFDAAKEASPANGVNNEINTRTELIGYDPTLASLVGETMPNDAWRPHCP
jgi:hypothetical protein